MRKLIEEFAQAVAARATAVQVCIGHHPPGKKAPLLVSAQEREAKAREALEDAIAQASLYVGEITSLADDIRSGKRVLRADDITLVAQGSRANFKSGIDRYREPTLKDAKRGAEKIAQRAREAWEIIDPSLTTAAGVSGTQDQTFPHQSPIPSLKEE